MREHRTLSAGEIDNLPAKIRQIVDLSNEAGRKTEVEEAEMKDGARWITIRSDREDGGNGLNDNSVSAWWRISSSTRTKFCGGIRFGLFEHADLLRDRDVRNWIDIYSIGIVR